ncbi:hypothetical protein J1P26_20950 [Neobacillus sp. MM2021_6]|uniref:hypothetical protein n=1 Tax=Bacillaceae TaxID=186817 RepID=UPI00140CEA6D|nr:MULTISPECIES: hypothetical protein [Bacillaceae]MBO0962180.1 hypothetical protein [Neobacillus sp. MM2021_6]NHC19040.1 hypothetical protein [Bacillus sp. MM2020_4]
MKEIKIKIGDHFIMLIWKSPNLTNILMEYFESFLSTESHHSDLVINIEDGYGVSFKEYEVEITKDHDQIFFHRADYLIKVGKEYKFATISVHNELALKHALMNLFSSFIVYHNWGLLIHSSCAIENSKAHVFAGQSGAGKSTVARLSYPRNLLSDEATLVKITPEEVTIFNSPFRSELKATSFKGNVPLSSVLILYQALQNKRAKLGKSDALLHLMDKVFFWPHSQEETKGIFRLMTLLVKQVPVYELHFQKNNTFWELIS